MWVPLASSYLSFAECIFGNGDISILWSWKHCTDCSNSCWGMFSESLMPLLHNVRLFLARSANYQMYVHHYLHYNAASISMKYKYVLKLYSHSLFSNHQILSLLNPILWRAGDIIFSFHSFMILIISLQIPQHFLPTWNENLIPHPKLQTTNHRITTTTNMSSIKPKTSYQLTAFWYISRILMLTCTLIFSINYYQVYEVRSSSPSQLKSLIQKSLSQIPFFTLSVHKHILKVRYHNAWIGHHVVLIPFWLLFMFLQLSSSLRRCNLKLHRVLGRISLVISFYMNITVMLMFFTRQPLFGIDYFSFDFRHPHKVFSFYAATALFTAYWPVCMALMYKNASMKTIQKHRYWALQFVAAGFGSGITRVFAAIYLLLRLRLNPHTPIGVWEHDTMIGYSAWLGFGLTCLVTHFVAKVGMRDSKKMKGM